MDNNQNKFSNVDDYDLILEEKEKELKKEKRNKRILASSLLLLLLLGSTAVVAPIISVAVNNKNNSANINNIKIPNTLTFTNSDITTLIDGYKSEIQARKLSLKQFENDLVNITKKHIVASNIKIGTIVQSITFTQNKDTQTIFFNITLEENDKRKYLTSDDFSEATLTKNVLTIQKPDSVIINDFFTETDPIDNTKLNDLLQQIQNWIKDNQFTKEEFENSINDGTLKDKIKDWLGINADLIGNIKYEEPKLIIEPKPPYTFVSDSNTDLIVDGNIEISNIKFYRVIKFINLDNLFNKLNEIVHSINGEDTKPEDFKKYLETHSIKDTIYNNLNVENNQTFNKNDILNIELNNIDQLVISLKSYEYLKYQIEQNINFKINNNELIIDNLDFYYEGNVTENNFIISNQESFIVDQDPLQKLYNLEYLDGQNLNAPLPKNIILPKKLIKTHNVNVFWHRVFSSTELESIDMRNIGEFINLYGYNEDPDTGYTYNLKGSMNLISESMFEGCVNLKKVILPKTTEAIGIWAFYGCTSLESIEFPPNVNFVDQRIFEKSNIKWVKFTSKIKSIYGNAFSYSNYPITIYVPTQELKEYYSRLLNVKEIIVGEPPTN